MENYNNHPSQQTPEMFCTSVLLNVATQQTRFCENYGLYTLKRSMETAANRRSSWNFYKYCFNKTAIETLLLVKEKFLYWLCTQDDILKLMPFTNSCLRVGELVREVKNAGYQHKSLIISATAVFFFPLKKNDCSRDKQLLELSNDYLLFPLIAGVSVSS